MYPRTHVAPQHEFKNIAYEHKSSFVIIATQIGVVWLTTNHTMCSNQAFRFLKGGYKMVDLINLQES